MPTYTRHTEIQPMKTASSTIDAIYYNHVQTALKRIDTQIRFKIPTLKHLHFILQDDAWVVVDAVLNDMPILAWMNFQIEHRETLHEPIKCDVKYFHYAADRILDKTLEAMELVLGEKMADDLPDEIPHVLNFKKD